MPRKSRLTGAEIRSIRAPRRFPGSLFSLSVGRTGTTARFSCVVSRKIAPRAVDRNRIKRRMRAALDPLAKKAAPGAYLFVAKKRAGEASYQAIQKDIMSLIQSARSA